MKCSLVFAGVLAGLGAALLLTGTAGQARAQVTGSVNPGAEQTGPEAKDEQPPPGGCMPIGVTASGEIVFPFLCKGFIEQHKAANQKPTASDDASQKPVAADTQSKSTDEKSVATQPDAVAPQTADDAPAPEKGAQDTSPKPAVTEEQRPTVDAKPESADDKSAAKPPDSTASITKSAIAKSAPQPAEPAEPPERERKKRREGSAGPPGCTHFKSYDASSGTYTDYSRRRRACRS